MAKRACLSGRAMRCSCARRRASLRKFQRRFRDLGILLRPRGRRVHRLAVTSGSVFTPDFAANRRAFLVSRDRHIDVTNDTTPYRRRLIRRCEAREIPTMKTMRLALLATRPGRPGRMRGRWRRPERVEHGQLHRQQRRRRRRGRRRQPVCRVHAARVDRGSARRLRRHQLPVRLGLRRPVEPAARRPDHPVHHGQAHLPGQPVRRRGRRHRRGPGGGRRPDAHDRGRQHAGVPGFRRLRADQSRFAHRRRGLVHLADHLHVLHGRDQRHGRRGRRVTSGAASSSTATASPTTAPTATAPTAPATCCPRASPRTTAAATTRRIPASCAT